MKTITNSAAFFEADGFIKATDVLIIDHRDSISINSTEHAKDDLVIEGNKITGPGGWYVTWED